MSGNIKDPDDNQAVPVVVSQGVTVMTLLQTGPRIGEPALGPHVLDGAVLVFSGVGMPSENEFEQIITAAIGQQFPKKLQ